MIADILNSGFEGIPTSYSPRMDDVITLTLSARFFLSSIALARGKKFLTQRVGGFVLYHERISIFDSSAAADVHYLFALVIQTCVLTGIVFLNHLHDACSVLMTKISPLLLLKIYADFRLAYFLLKWLSCMFLEWVFFNKNKVSTWLEFYSTLIYYVGFAPFPSVLFPIYFNLNLTNLAIIGLIVLTFARMLMFCKRVKLSFRQLSATPLLILYFCALKIISCLLLYQGMIRVDNVLLIKV